MTPQEAYWCAYYNYTKPGFDLDYYQKIACQNPECSYWFAREIPGADIKHCRKACESDTEILNQFDKMVAKRAML